MGLAASSANYSNTKPTLTITTNTKFSISLSDRIIVLFYIISCWTNDYLDNLIIVQYPDSNFQNEIVVI